MPFLVPEPVILHIGRSKVPGNTSRSYCSDDYWALHLYFDYAELTIENNHFDVNPGSLSITPRGSESCYRTEKPLDHIFVHFTADTEGTVFELPYFVQGGPDTEPAAGSLITGLSVFRAFPDWTRIKVADTLFSMAHVIHSKHEKTVEQSALGGVLSFIDLNLSDIHRLDDLAQHLSVSRTHVNRLFRDQLGISAMRYVRDKRMELARYLLTATGLTIKDIAYQIGIPDLHAFNKLCKKQYGMSPSALRRTVV